MNLARGQKAEINIKNSVNVDTVQQDVYLFGDQSVPLLKNNGIERDGGVTNVYEVETAMKPNSTSYITPEGDVITKGWDGLVSLKGINLGTVSPFSVQDMCSIKQVDDVILSEKTKTYITLKLVGNTVELIEYDIATTPTSGNPFGDNEITFDSKPTVGVFPSQTLFPSEDLYPSSVGAPLHQRSVQLSISGISDISSVYTSLSFVRSAITNWDDNFELILRIGDDVYKFQESSPSSPLLFDGLLAGFNQLNYIYCFNYGTAYLLNMVGNNQNKSFVITSWSLKNKTDITCRYAVPQTKNGKTRHFITCDPVTDASMTKSAGLVGYTDFINFTPSIVWPLLSSTYNSTTHDQPTVFNTGFGYSEYVIKTTASETYTNVYAPNFVTDDTAYLHATQSNTKTLYNYYGKLNNLNDVTPTRQLEFRVGQINGTQAYLSVAPLDASSQTNGTKDMLGVILTEVGAFDDSYMPHLITDNTILYKAYNNFYIVAIDYDAGTGYFNSSNWSEAVFDGVADPQLLDGVITTTSYNTTPSVTLTLPTPLRGGQYRYITIRYKTDDPSPIVMQYSNSQHSFSSSFQKTILPVADGRYHVQVFNMSQLDNLNADYISYEVDAIRILMGAIPGSTWSLYSTYMSYKTLQYVPQVQKVSDNAYKLNTINPLNVVNIRTGLIEPASMDYNGRMKFSYTGTQALIPYRVCANINSVFGNSIDVGEKLISCDLNVSSTSSVIDAIGTRLIGSTSYSVDIYSSPTSAPASTPIYSFSIKESGTELIDPVKVDTPYQQNAVLPVPLGYRYNQFSVYARSSTIFLNTTNPVSIGNIGQGTSIGYDGYTLGNDIPGTYVPFYLFGNRYIQDATYIYLVNFQNDVYQGHDKIAPSIGMDYIGSSPEIVYFLSTFDNSIYTFTGSRSLTKYKRFSQADKIINGLYSTKDNTLLLNAENSYIWVRDNIITINEKKFEQSGDMTLFETRDGLIIMNQFYYWAYTYNQLNYDAQYTLVPLEWQHAHFGIARNQKSILHEMVYTILNVERQKKASFNVIIYTKDENDNYLRQSRTITLWPKDFNEAGYASFRVKPQQYKNVATSVYLKQIGIDPPKIVLLNATAVLAEDTNAVLAARKTR